MNNLQLGFTKIEIDAARTLFNKISKSSIKENSTAGFCSYEKEDFFSNSDFELLPFAQFTSCSFFDIVRTGLKGNNLSIKKSYFENCYFEGSNLKYTNFNETILQISAEATSFDYSDYTNAEIFNSKFLGCSFTGGFFLKTKIHNCEFHEVEFTDATFINVSFESIDFSKTSMENAEFKECTFVNCILPYFEILRISSGLNDILQNNNVFFKTVRGNYLSDISQYSIEIHELLPVFFANNDFMTLANIYIFEGNHNAAFSSIVDGIKYACKLKDFKQINNLCKLAVNNNFFTSKQLQEFYQIFKNNIKINDLSIVEYYRVLNELAEAQKLLLDFSIAPNIMYVTLETNYCYSDTEKLATTIQRIYEAIDLIDSSLGNSMVIRHNSPPVFVISLFGEIDSLILIFAVISYIFFKTTSYIERIQQLWKNHNDLKLQKLDIKLKQLEFKQKTEKKSQILIPEDFKDVSYIMKAEPSCPKDLLCFEIKKGISGK